MMITNDKSLICKKDPGDFFPTARCRIIKKGMPKTSKQNIKLCSKDLTITAGKFVCTVSYDSKRKTTVDYDSD